MKKTSFFNKQITIRDVIIMIEELKIDLTPKEIDGKRAIPDKEGYPMTNMEYWKAVERNDILNVVIDALDKFK